MAWGVAAMGAMELGNRMVDNAQSGKASARQYAYNLALQQQAQAWNEYMYKNRYQMQVQDLEKAGINKLYGLGQAPAVTSGANSVGMEDDQGNATARNRLALDIMNTKVEMNARQAETELTKNQAQTELINANVKQQEALGKQLDNVQKQMQNNATPQRIKLELRNEEAKLKNQMKDLEVKNQQIIESNENIKVNKYNAKTGRINAQTNQMVGKSQSWKNYKGSLGYNTTLKAGPILFSHTGNPNGYTRNAGQNARYVTENINGHKVKVKVYR